MFDTDNEKPVTITMIMHHSDGRSVQMNADYADDTTWMRIAYQFYCFLAAQGYVLEKESVGSTDDDL